MTSYLNTENIERSCGGVEYHPLRPFLPAEARVLFLGSFPPQRKRWCMDFYYPNFINDHWRIEGEVFYADRDYFVNRERRCFDMERIVEHCERVGIALYDTCTAVRRLRDNASDAHLEVVEATDIGALLARLPRCRAIATTGEKATATICQSMGIGEMPGVGASVAVDSTGLRLYRLPSSSRAYPLAFAKKVEAYARMFAEVMEW